MLKQYESLLKIGAFTFCGAFFGAITMSGGLPTTAAGLKAVLMPALGAGIAAEITYLRSVFQSVQVPQTPPQTPPAQS
jgi:hypothetical protein